MPVDVNVRDRATELQGSLGIKSYDALHIASAEQAGADVFLSTDDKLVRAARRQQESTKVEIENPLTWLQSVVQ